MEENKSKAIIIYILILLNYALFFIDTYLIDLSFLYLDHKNQEFYQFFTSAFFHGSFTHLTGNMFFIYFFGKMIEEELKAENLLFLYCASIISVNVINYFVSTNIDYSIGASGVVFSLFTVSIYMKINKAWRSWVEILVLAPFVISYIFTEINSMGLNDSIGHIAHLSGAVIGVFLYWLIKKLVISQSY